jgi:hypothetical protein
MFTACVAAEVVGMEEALEVETSEAVAWASALAASFFR